MTNGDGNGWVRCGRGHRHWGRHGAAGLLIAAPDEAGRQTVLLQQRSWWGRHGGAWGPPGGARDSHESAVRAALREAIEECAIDPRPVRVHGVVTDDHGGWTYQTVLASTAAPLAAAAVSEETSEVAWVPVAEVERLRLHPGFAGQWPALRAALSPLTVIVDAANVMGSRPDGWWRDRAGAARRLCDQIEGLAMDGVTGVPDSVQVPALERWFPHFVVVLEGAAAAGVGEASTDNQVRIVLASGSGDDEIVRQAAETIRQAGEKVRQAAESAGPCLVVTADRELRVRCQAAGAAVVGPRWLLDLL
jgi:8-oxo-dGTP diphosphatase